jgi:glycosyltransferase involved in cell wall biosynthesis
MRIYWFWPYVHDDQLVLPAAVPGAGDDLVLHTMGGRITPEAAAGLPIVVRPTLATPADTRERTLRWAANRASTYVQRIAQRHRALREGHFDVCHVVFSNYFVDGVDFRTIARRTPLVFEVHDVVPHQARVPRRIERALLSLLYRAPGAIIVRHEVVRDGLVDGFGIDPAKITLIPWHVPEVGPVARTRPNDSPTVLFFGTLRRNKGVATLLAAIAQLADLADARFVFAGRGFPDVEEQIHAAAASDPRICFDPGYVSADRKDALYRAADLVAMPYVEMPSASAVLCDAYAYSVPVVASDVGGLGASVRADSTGWVVPPSEPAALADALRNALRDPDVWSAAAANAARIAANRTPERTAEQLREVYDRVRAGTDACHPSSPAR